MSIAAIKEEAIRQFAIKVDNLQDEDALKVILDFLNNIHTEDKGAINLSRHYEGIKQKYGTVLEKLAK